MTSDAAPLPDALGEVSAALARTQIAKIFASRHFRKADRLKRFLQFVTEETLIGRSAQIKESVIGLTVFHRRAATYDPSVDPIVRVQAGRVRAKLITYYEQEGAGDHVLIEVPRGQYVPTFRMRPSVPLHSSGARPDLEIEAWPANVVAVLPFLNMSADRESEYFSNGLTEELTHSLACIPSIHITARRSALQFRRRDRDVREIGRVLGAGKIVVGSVRKAEDQLRISVQLVNVADGLQIWSEKYDRTMRDVFALQDEIADAIGQALSRHLALSPQLAEAREPRGPRGQTKSLEAFNHYLKGRFHWNKRGERGLRTAILHFQEALRVDPDYGRAYSGLADCYIMLSMSGAEAPAGCMPLARRAALRAVEIDDSLVEAHTSLAAVRANFDWDRTGAEREFQRALELDRSYATLHHWYSLISLLPEGRFDEAEDEIQWAEQLDPISLPINLAHAFVLLIGNNCQAAISQCTKVLGLDPNYYRAHWFMGLAHDRLGDFEAAIAALEIARNRGRGENAFHGRILGALGHAYARWGKPDRARAILDEMTAISITAYLDPFEVAQVHLGLGDVDTALDTLERAAEERSGYLVHIGVWPGFEVLRSSVRFKALLSRLSLGIHPGP